MTPKQVLDLLGRLSPEDALAVVESMTPQARAEVQSLATELNRRACRNDYLSWCEEVGADLGFAPAEHHKVIIDHVERVIQGEIPRLIVNAPPGSAKSTYTSQWLPAHILSRKPGFNLIGASNTSTLAEDFSERTLALIDSRPDLVPFHLKKRSAPLWTTSQGGRYRAAGVGVAIAGNRADGVIIDDPVKSRADVESETQREKVWNWFIADLRTRLKPKAWIILILTRWHQDDLAGRLLERQPGKWTVLNLPAQAFGPDPDTGVVPIDALGREPGEFLWKDDEEYGYGNALPLLKEEFRQAGATREWNSLFQGRPGDVEGTVFKVGLLSIVEQAPDLSAQIARGWDLAATKKMGTNDPDYLVGVKVARTADGRYIVLDVERHRVGPEDVERVIVQTAIRDGKRVRIGLPQDPGSAGKVQVTLLGKALAGYRVEASPETGDKATRAAPAAAQVNLGTVSMIRAEWNAPFRAELAAFPGGTHDDQVDGFARAFSMVALHRPLVVSNETLRDFKNGLRKIRT